MILYAFILTYISTVLTCWNDWGFYSFKCLHQWRPHMYPSKSCCWWCKSSIFAVLSQKNGRVHSVAKVWTLSNEGKHNTSVLGVCKNKRYPLFPWKRAKILAPRLRRGRPPHEGKMGALFFHIRSVSYICLVLFIILMNTRRWQFVLVPKYVSFDIGSTSTIF